MTALSNLVSNLDKPNPEILTYFPLGYREKLVDKINDDKLFAAKSVVEMYLKNFLKDDIINYKLYSYKTLQGISVEVLIQPENSSVIIQYRLDISESKVTWTRLR